MQPRTPSVYDKFTRISNELNARPINETTASVKALKDELIKLTQRTREEERILTCLIRLEDALPLDGLNSDKTNRDAKEKCIKIFDRFNSAVDSLLDMLIYWGLLFSSADAFSTRCLVEDDEELDRAKTNRNANINQAKYDPSGVVVLTMGAGFLTTILLLACLPSGFGAFAACGLVGMYTGAWAGWKVGRNHGLLAGLAAGFVGLVLGPVVVAVELVVATLGLAIASCIDFVRSKKAKPGVPPLASHKDSLPVGSCGSSNAKLDEIIPGLGVAPHPTSVVLATTSVVSTSGPTGKAGYDVSVTKELVLPSQTLGARS